MLELLSRKVTYRSLKRGIILYKSSMEFRFLFSAYCLIMFNIFTKLKERFMNEYNSIKKETVDGVMVLVLCTLSDDSLYLIQVLWKYLNEL